jgi:nitrate/nitrite transport system substrate-binding protein
MFRAGLRSATYCNAKENRHSIAAAVAPAAYLNQPPLVVEQALTGHYADGLGQVRDAPERIRFEPFPWQSTATWIMTQMKRWGYIKGEVNWQRLAREIYLVTDAKKHLLELSYRQPPEEKKIITIMGKDFNYEAPDAYVDSFRIRRG